jgi:hypothetical protein
MRLANACVLQLQAQQKASQHQLLTCLVDISLYTADTLLLLEGHVMMPKVELWQAIVKLLGKCVDTGQASYIAMQAALVRILT